MLFTNNHSLKHINSLSQLVLLILSITLLLLDFKISTIVFLIWIFDFEFYPKYRVKNTRNNVKFIVKRTEWKKFNKEI